MINETDPLYPVFNKIIKKHWKFDLVNRNYIMANEISVGNPGCLDENTKIKIVKNERISKSRKLKNLSNSFTVCSYNKNLDIIEKDIAIKIDSGEKECFEIELENGEKIVATEDHIFFKKGITEIRVKDLKIGDNLILFKHIRFKETGRKNNFLKMENIKDVLF